MYRNFSLHYQDMGTTISYKPPLSFFFTSKYLHPRIANQETQPRNLRSIPSTTMPPRTPNNGIIRHDLTPHQLFYLSFLRIYVTASPRTVAFHFNRTFDPQQPLMARDSVATYINLHNSEHESWIRARDMNREEPELLKIMIQFLGLPRKRWDLDLIQPVGPMACLRAGG